MVRYFYIHNGCGSQRAELVERPEKARTSTTSSRTSCLAKMAKMTACIMGQALSHITIRRLNKTSVKDRHHLEMLEPLPELSTQEVRLRIVSRARLDRMWTLGCRRLTWKSRRARYENGPRCAAMDIAPKGMKLGLSPSS